MKKFQQFLRESLMSIKMDSEQLYLLQTGKIDEKSFALNVSITEEDAKWCKDIVQSDAIQIISSDQMLEKYDRKEVQKLIDRVDDLEALGERYGSEIGLSPEEKKAREEQKKAIELANEAEKEHRVPGGEDKKPKGPVDDSWLIKAVATDFSPIEFSRIQKFFWKRSGNNAYLYLIIDMTDDVKKLINLI